MKCVFSGFLSFVVFTVMVSVTSPAADPCPAELTEAKAALKSAQASIQNSSQAAQGSDIQARRAMAGAKSQEIQAPRDNQNVQAPRGNQDVQAPRTMAGAKSQAVQVPKVNKAATLLRQADAACKKGDMTLSAQKAKEALALLKQ